MDLALDATAPATPTRARHHRVVGTYNLRDTGGYPARSGTTRWGKLFRSDALHLLTDESRATLRQLQIGLVIDLRHTSELTRSPSRLAGLDLVTVHTPIFAEAAPTSLAQGEVSLETLYHTMIESFGDNLGAAVRSIARSGDTGVLVHCTAGKDRTGLVIALALLAVGVPHAEVIADYAATAEHLRGDWSQAILDQMLDHGVPRTPELEELISASPPELLAKVIDRIDTDHGSVVHYLRAHGLTAADLTALHAALVAPHPEKEHTS